MDQRKLREISKPRIVTRSTVWRQNIATEFWHDAKPFRSPLRETMYGFCQQTLLGCELKPFAATSIPSFDVPGGENTLIEWMPTIQGRFAPNPYDASASNLLTSVALPHPKRFLIRYVTSDLWAQPKSSIFPVRPGAPTITIGWHGPAPVHEITQDGPCV